MTTSIQQCVICYEELDRDLSAAPCGHVFHSVCIDRWHSHGSHCPMCHDNLPPKLLRLFFEAKQEAAQASVLTSSGGVADRTKLSSDDARDGQHQQRTSSDPEVIRLRRELASMTKLDCTNKEKYGRLSRKLAEVLNELLETKVTHNISQQEVEGQLKSATSELKAVKIELCKIHKENNRVKREMRGTQDLLRESQGEKSALDFLHQVASKTTGARSLNGLGQVNVDRILRLVAEGSAKAETVIKGQYDILTATIERERRTKRELNQSKAENEARELEVQKLRTKLVNSKRDCHLLAQGLNRVRQELPRGSTSPNNPAVGSLEENETQRIESPRDWQVSDLVFLRRPNGEPRRGNNQAVRRPVLVGRSVGSTDAVHETRRLLPGKRRASTMEGDNGMVSLGSGSDDESGSDAEDKEGDAQETTGKGREGGRNINPTLSLRQLEEQTLVTQAISSHSFLGSVANGRSSSRKPGKFIRSGFNAMGGRHNVRSASNDQSRLGCTHNLNAACPR